LRCQKALRGCGGGASRARCSDRVLLGAGSPVRCWVAALAWRTARREEHAGAQRTPANSC
jgi:hypothetical protein